MSDTKSPEVQFLHFVLVSIVDHPDEIQIERKIDDLGTLIELTVHEGDVGKVIGKSGQTLKAIRVLLRLLGAKQGGDRINLKLLEH